MQRTQGAMEELDEQLAAQATPEMKSKHRELKEAEQQLLDIEARLGEPLPFFHLHFSS